MSSVQRPTSKKLKAFTLIEVLVTMLLTTIIIGIIYYAYEVVQKQFIHNKTNDEGITQLSMLNYLLEKDFNESAEVIAANNGITFLYNDLKSINYEFDEEYILRNTENVTDTFKIAVENATQLFLESLVNKGDLVDRLEMDLKYSKESLYFVYTKEYASDILLQLELNNGKD